MGALMAAGEAIATSRDHRVALRAELCCCAERCIGLAIRKGQEEGRILRNSQKRAAVGNASSTVEEAGKPALDREHPRADAPRLTPLGVGANLARTGLRRTDSPSERGAGKWLKNLEVWGMHEGTEAGSGVGIPAGLAARIRAWVRAPRGAGCVGPPTTSAPPWSRRALP